jgi:hypothetical protein
MVRSTHNFEGESIAAGAVRIWPSAARKVENRIWLSAIVIMARDKEQTDEKKREFAGKPSAGQACF